MTSFAILCPRRRRLWVGYHASKHGKPIVIKLCQRRRSEPFDPVRDRTDALTLMQEGAMLCLTV